MPMPSIMQKPHLDKTCDCGMGKFVEPGDGNEWSLICNDCSKVLFCYEPLPHQAKFHADKSKFRLFAGG